MLGPMVGSSSMARLIGVSGEEVGLSAAQELLEEVFWVASSAFIEEYT